jgi:hypothetical protein
MIKKYLLISFLALIGCETNNIKTELVIPEKYDGAAYEINSSDEIKARIALNDLSNEMKKGRTGLRVESTNTTIHLSILKPLVTTYYMKFIEEKLLPELLASNTGKLLNPGKEGGLYGDNLFNKYGIENEQVIEKGLYASAFYNSAYTIATGTRDQKTTDKIVALFGAHPNFANSNNSALHNNPDVFIANYVARRDKNDGSGFYSNVQNGLIKLQAAIKAGNAYSKEQDDAVVLIFENWEKGSASTAINYIYSVISKLSSTNPDDATKASALHSFSEVLGFLHGFKGVNEKIITDKEIDELLTLLNVPVGEIPKTLNFLSQPATELPKIVQVLTKLQNIYGFSTAEMEDFKKNWVSEQNR